MKKLLTVAVVLALAGTSFAADDMTKVGGQPMLPTKNIVENAVNSADHTALVAAVKAAGLVETLQGAGPFTVFAPTSDAFENLPAGAVESLLKPENKGKLTALLTYHVVAGRLTAKDLWKIVKSGKGKAELKSVQETALCGCWPMAII